MAPNGIKFVKMGQNGSKYVRIGLNGSKLVQTCPQTTTCSLPRSLQSNKKRGFLEGTHNIPRTLPPIDSISLAKVKFMRNIHNSCSKSVLQMNKGNVTQFKKICYHFYFLPSNVLHRVGLLSVYRG